MGETAFQHPQKPTAVKTEKIEIHGFRARKSKKIDLGKDARRAARERVLPHFLATRSLRGSFSYYRMPQTFTLAAGTHMRDAP
jgi:hypothetical protein